jgi:hypothetical protein
MKNKKQPNPRRKNGLFRGALMLQNKIALASVFMAAASASTAEIVINEFLSFEGFVDMAYAHYDGRVHSNDSDEAGQHGAHSDNRYAVDQIELSWLFGFERVTAQIDLEYEEGDSGTEVDQAYVTYDLAPGHALTAGRYDSMLGFEAFEPTGLYQVSRAYGFPRALAEDGDFDDMVVDGGASVVFPLPGTNQGVRYTYQTDQATFAVSVQDGVYQYADRLGGSDEGEDGGGYGLEAGCGYEVADGWALFVGAAYEDGDSTALADSSESYVVNGYLSYESGPWLLAAEVNYGESELGRVRISPETTQTAVSDLHTRSVSGLLMANYAYTTRASVTGRFSFVDADVDDYRDLDAYESVQYTLAHNYAVTDHLRVVAEVSYIEGEGDDDRDILEFEELLGALKLIFAF